MLIAIGLVALGCGGEAGESLAEREPEEMPTEAPSEAAVPEAWCCELRATNGYLVDHLCLQGATERPAVSADYRCWEVP